MGYPIFGKVKTIVLPLIPADVAMTLDEYKERTGIDLKEILILDSDSKAIKFRDGNYQILLNAELEKEYVNGLLPPITSIYGISESIYESGVSDGCLYLTAIGYVSMNFIIDKDDEFSIENMKVIVAEI